MRILTLGDTAVTLEFPDISGRQGAFYIRRLREKIEGLIDDDRLEGVVDLISATRSLTLCIDIEKTQLQELIGKLETVKLPDQKTDGADSDVQKIWHLPTCYHGACAPDLENVAKQCGLSVDDVIKKHSAATYDVLTIGFLPGFAFMGEVEPALQLPRKTTPNLKVPPGSVAIANAQTAIYPWESPGGWHLIGNCPVPLFDPERTPPSLFTPGDKVRFVPVDPSEFDRIQQDLKLGNIDVQSFLKEGEALA